MRELFGQGTIIAVNANPATEAASDFGIGPIVSGWRLLGHKLMPWRAPVNVPTIAATVLRASSLNGANRLAENQRLADLTISPPVAQLGILDFSAYQSVIDIGYKTAKREIAGWQE